MTPKMENKTEHVCLGMMCWNVGPENILKSFRV